MVLILSDMSVQTIFLHWTTTSCLGFHSAMRFWFTSYFSAYFSIFFQDHFFLTPRPFNAGFHGISYESHLFSHSTSSLRNINVYDSMTIYTMVPSLCLHTGFPLEPRISVCSGLLRHSDVSHSVWPNHHDILCPNLASLGFPVQWTSPVSVPQLPKLECWVSALPIPSPSLLKSKQLQGPLDNITDNSPVCPLFPTPCSYDSHSHYLSLHHLNPSNGPLTGLPPRPSPHRQSDVAANLIM